MGTKIQAVGNDLKSKGLQPIYIVEGVERLLVDEALQTLISAATEGQPDMTVRRLDLGESGCDAKTILAECQSMGLFSTRTLVVVRATEVIDKKTKIRDELGDYAKAPNPDATLILVASKLNKSSRLYKTVKKAGAVYSFEPLKTREAPAWVQQAARDVGHRMDIATARFVVDLAGTNLLQLQLVIDQLSLYVGPGNPIDNHTVETVLAATRPHSIFELVDAMAEQRPERALRHLGAMLEHREPALRILAMIVRHFRLLWQVQYARTQGASQDDIIRDLKIHPFQAKKLYGQATRFSPEFIRVTYERLFETDAALKSSGVSDHMVLEDLLMRLCRVGRTRARR